MDQHSGWMVVLGLRGSLARPPSGKDAGDVNSLQSGFPLGPKFRHDISDCNCFKPSQGALLRMSDVVVPQGQKTHSHKAARRRSREVGKGECVMTGIGLINQGKCKGMSHANNCVPAAGGDVSRVFMQRNLCQ